jgi:membrane-associated phospholipid phosphatase
MLLRRCLLLLSMIFGLVSPAYSLNEDTWDTISGVGAYSLIGTALILPTTRADWEGLKQSVWSIGTTAATTSVLKALIDEERPDESDDDSFPSGHTANSFASATTLHRRYGWQIGLPAYAVATVTGIAREKSREHHWYDVVAGAALGSFTGWYFTDAFNEQVQISPWADSEGGGISISMRW